MSGVWGSHGGHTPRRRCPVCYRRVAPTRGGLIYGHWDSLGRDRCPSSWEPYDITIRGDRKDIATVTYPGHEVTHHGHTERISA